MSFAKILEFHKVLQEEVKGSGDEVLKDYYRNIYYNKKNRWFYSFNWSRRIENMPVFSRSQNFFILDAGCGTGTESIFFASQGAKVVGIDLNKDKINTARRRKNYYEKMFQKELAVDFQAKNIFNLQPSDQFDIIWCSEAISHIYPIDSFIKRACYLLRSGGLLIISDTNILNPVARLQLFSVRRGVFESLDPETGEKIKYANENIQNPHGLSSIIRKNGFNVQKIDFSVFLHPSVFKENTINKIYKMEKWINRIPVLRSIGVVYTITGVKIKNQG